MKETKLQEFIQEVITHVPSDWLKLTTHRLDIYKEQLAKTEFLQEFEALYRQDNAQTQALQSLPTAYDYIRLGHPLSTVLEWTLAQDYGLHPDQVISFSSRTMPLLAVLRTNKLANKPTRIAHFDQLPQYLDWAALRDVYGYEFEVQSIKDLSELKTFEGSTVVLTNQHPDAQKELPAAIDFFIYTHAQWGSWILINGNQNKEYTGAIQHVRRRESIAMTPDNCYRALKAWAGMAGADAPQDRLQNEPAVQQTLAEITATSSPALLGSCGLSVQYAIMMGLVDEAREQYPGKAIKFVVPPNCYGGTNDQARRVAASVPNVSILDLPVDGENDMVQSTQKVLDQVAAADAVPFIIAEIPTNPRVEVPDLEALREALIERRSTPEGAPAVDPVFILDQTFCPNVQFLGAKGILSEVRTISYVSGSKFPSGGKCTAGYCVANEQAAHLMPKIEKHLKLCDNEATDLQVAILAEQLPSMLERIKGAYQNTRAFVNFIEETLPTAKINFVSEELAQQGFTPSVFSLDLPTKGNSHEEREAYKRELNHKLIRMMISQIPEESKYCVSYGQLKGCYWTIPATSTQGTTKEADKDYIARVSVSPNLDLERHKQVFADFVNQLP